MHQRDFDTPDSPFSESVDDWSSFAELNSDDDSTQFIMPRPTSLDLAVPSLGPPAVAAAAAPPGPGTGKLRVLVLGGIQSGKSELIRALPYTQLLGAGAPKVAQRGGGLVTTDFNVRAAEPNISFVDGGSPAYIDSQLAETAELVNGAHPMAVALLARATSLDHSQLVDCCLYLFDDDEISSADMHILKQVSALVPTIPVLSKSDCVGGVDLFERRVRIKRALENLGLNMFYFDGQALPYAVSSQTSLNWDMTLSVVEHEGYQSQHLVESQLAELVDNLLGAAAELRHHAALGFSERVRGAGGSSSCYGPYGSLRLQLPNNMLTRPTTLSSCSKMRPIRNIDPLDVGRWAQTLGFITFFLTVAGGVALAPEVVV